MQANFTHVRRGRDRLLAFVATLGYSRSSFVRFTVAEDAMTLCTCLREAMTYFGGVALAQDRDLHAKKRATPRSVGGGPWSLVGGIALLSAQLEGG